MEDSTKPQNLKFLEDLQKASQEIEDDIQKKKTTSNPLPEVKTTIYPTPRDPNESLGGRREGRSPSEVKGEEREAPPKPPLERIFEQDLVTKIEEITKERKRLEETRRNLENRQRAIQQRIQELNNLCQRIQRVIEERKKIIAELQTFEEKNKKISEDLNEFSSS